MFKLTTRTALLTGWLSLWLAPPCTAQTPTADANQAWLAYQAALLQDSSLLRYYTLGAGREPAAPILNLASSEGPLTRALAQGGGQPDQGLARADGRWPQKPAVHLDRDFLSGEAPAVTDRAFTVAGWFRLRGPGAIRGDAVPLGGTLLSVGNGFWDGWRMTLLYPDKTLGFEIGRPQPASSMGIRGGVVAEGIWHHLAAGWDGRVMRIYVDGLVAAVGEFSGAYTPPARGGKLRIGFANAGWGSLAVDVDEVTVFGRAFTPVEVLRHAVFHASLPEPLAVRWAAGQQAAEAKDYAVAAAEFAAFAETAEIPPDFQAAARLRLGRVAIEQKQAAVAAAAYSRVLERSDVGPAYRAAAVASLLQLLPQVGAGLGPRALAALLELPELAPRDRALAQFQLARLLRQEGDFATARKQYAQLLTLAALSSREKLDAGLELAHTALAAKDFAAAREAYARILQDADAPSHYKSQAQLQLAASYLREQNFSAARSEYAKCATLPDAPEHHRWEAQECLQEIARLQAGLPARDPARWRQQVPPRPTPAVELYVAPDGRDTQPGSQDQPFATLERARDRIRELKRQSGLPLGGVTVYLRGGTYLRTQTFSLTAEDSGTADSPIIYRGYAREAALLNGGVRLTGFQPVQNPAILARLPAASRGQVRQLDLRAAGITNYGRVGPRGFGRGALPAVELFCDGRPMTPARWPNAGWLRVGPVVQAGPVAGKAGFVFQYAGDQPLRWQQARDIFVYGYWNWLWADNALPVASIDTQKRELATAEHGAYQVVAGQPYYVFNLLEELDQPGEWYLDRHQGLLYFYPPVDPAAATVQMSLLETPLVSLDNVCHVAFQRVACELGRGEGVVVRGGTHCLIAGCVLRRLGGTGVVIQGGTQHGVLGCDLVQLGRGGTVVVGGDRKTLTPGGHFVENCQIYDFSRLDRTYTPAVQLEGVGNRIAHNLFHHSPCHAMRVEGNDHVIELNEIHHVVTESDDQGGLDMFFNPSYRGNILRWNFWHDIGSGHECGQAGIRLDDAICGTLIYGNVFQRCSHANFGGVQIHGGKDNLLDNNVFVDCQNAISFSPWGADRWAKTLAGEAVVKQTTEAVDIRQPPYSTRYPALAQLAEHPDVNGVWRNVVYRCGGFLTRDGGIQDLRDNLLLDRDPGFVDAAHGNFALQAGCPLLESSDLRPIPFDEIGPYADEFRATWPVSPK